MRAAIRFVRLLDVGVEGRREDGREDEEHDERDDLRESVIPFFCRFALFEVKIPYLAKADTGLEEHDALPALLEALNAIDS